VRGGLTWWLDSGRAWRHKGTVMETRRLVTEKPIRQKLMAAVLTLSAVPGAALGQTAVPAPAPAAAVLPGNTVDCIYASFSPEDQEIGLLLLASEMISGNGYRTGSKNVRAVNRIIDDAAAGCISRFRWNERLTDAAKGYALTALLNEALRQSIETIGHSAAPIDDYYRQNRAALIRKTDIEGADKERLTTYLAGKGWDAEKASELGIAALYLETLMMKADADRQFAAAVQRKPMVRSPARATKARRGKP